MPKKTAVAKKTTAVAKKTTDEKTAELSEQWLELVRTGEQTAIETLRGFVETVEQAVPGPARQREIVESGLEMAEAIVHVQSDSLRGLLRSAALVNVNVNVDTDVTVDSDVGVEVPTNVDVPVDSDVGVEVPTNVDVASRESTT